MAALPDEVVATIAVSQSVDPEQAAQTKSTEDAQRNDTLIRRVFSKLAKLLAQATESEVIETMDEGEQTDRNNQTASCGTANCHPLAYGYPPAYGVPSNIAVQLLSETFQLLGKVLDEVDDKELIEAINNLRERIGQALGVNAQANSFYDNYNELRLALVVSLGTQPVLPPSEAAERLRNAWNKFNEVVRSDEFEITRGQMFDAAFALRAAIEAALKSLGAVAIQTESNENAEAVEAGQQGESSDAQTENNEPQIEASEQASNLCQSTDESVSTETEQGDQHEAQIMASNASVDGMQESETKSDENLAKLIREAIAPIISRIDELAERIEAVENATRNRRRVSSFVASSSRQAKEDDIWQLWINASEKERKMLLREAQKLLAAPLPLDKD